MYSSVLCIRLYHKYVGNVPLSFLNQNYAWIILNFSFASSISTTFEALVIKSIQFIALRNHLRFPAQRTAYLRYRNRFRCLSCASKRWLRTSAHVERFWHICLQIFTKRRDLFTLPEFLRLKFKVGSSSIRRFGPGMNISTVPGNRLLPRTGFIPPEGYRTLNT